MVSATQTLQHKPPENGIILLYSPFSQKREIVEISLEGWKVNLKMLLWQGREIMALFRCLTEKFLWDSLNLQKLSILQKPILQRETELEALKALAFTSCAWDEGNKPHTPPDFFSWKMPAWWFKPWGQPKASPQGRLCQPSTAPPPLVLPPQHCWWPIKCPDCPNAQNWWYRQKVRKNFLH